MNGQRGFTLTEMAIALFVLAVISVLIGVAINQMVTIPEQGNARVEASHTLQDVVNLMSYDVVQASSATTGSTLTLTMPDTTVITYYLSGTAMQRAVDGANETIAQNISSLSFSISNRVISMSITSTPDNRWNISKSSTYRFALRVTG